MLAGMQRKGNTFALLVGMQTGLATLGDSMEVPQKVNNCGAPGWRSRLSVQLQPGHDLAVCEFEPRIRLWADGWSLEPVSDSVSPSLSAPPPFMLCLSLSQK